jgi:hypothetical protein
MDLRAQLSQIIPPARTLTSYLHRIAYANDASYFHLVPQAVVQPDSIKEIQALFEFTRQAHIPMTFRAAGTSLSGQAVTDGILVDISKHWGSYQVEENASLIRTQPGIVGGFLNNVLKPFGRRIGPDPASIDACMMGGILANNSSGMCCGVTENAYRTIHSMTMVLPNGPVLNTAEPDAAAQLHEGAPEIERGLLELKKRILNSTSEYKGETLAKKIRRRYQMKNNNGYLLNAFLDFDRPLDILVHLMIGSEGTLGFIAEAVLNTLPDYPRRYTGQLYFKNLQDAASAPPPSCRSKTPGRGPPRSWTGPPCVRFNIIPVCLPSCASSRMGRLPFWSSIRPGMPTPFLSSKKPPGRSSNRFGSCTIRSLPTIRQPRPRCGRRARGSSRPSAGCALPGAPASTKMWSFPSTAWPRP